MLTTDKYWEKPDKKPEVDKIIESIENWSIKSPSVVDSDEEEDPNLEYNDDFDQMKERESLPARQHFQSQSHSLGGLHKKFNSQAKLLRKI